MLVIKIQNITDNTNKNLKIKLDKCVIDSEREENGKTLKRSHNVDSHRTYELDVHYCDFLRDLTMTDGKKHVICSIIGLLGVTNPSYGITKTLFSIITLLLDSIKFSVCFSDKC